MRLSTLPGVLFLQRASILDAFHSRWSLAVGAILVLSAGVARNYDGEDLLAEPWWLAAPFGASLVTSLVLWCLFIPWAKAPGPSLWRLYPRFLGIYWLTAPLAWLYAIPYERVLTPVDAVTANAYTLMVVSLWRVVIISRALSLLFSIRLHATLFFTLMFGSLVMFGAAWLGPRPVLDVMGGLRLPPEDNARAGLTFLTGIFSLAGIFVFGLLAAINRPRNPSAVQPATAAPDPELNPPLAPLAPLTTGLLCVLAWAPALMVAQPEQRNRRHAEQLFKSGDYPGLLHELSSHTIEQYPPGWRIPGSHLGAGSRRELASTLLPHINEHTAPWVRSNYTKLARESLTYFRPFIPSDDWVTDAIEDAQRYAHHERGAEFRNVLGWLMNNDPSITAAQRSEINTFLNPPSAEPPSPPP